MTEPFKPIPYRDYLGRRRVIVEVPSTPPASRKSVKRHEHFSKVGGVEQRTEHWHLVDLDAPEHMHGEDSDGAA